MQPKQVAISLPIANCSPDMDAVTRWLSSSRDIRKKAAATAAELHRLVASLSADDLLRRSAGQLDPAGWLDDLTAAARATRLGLREERRQFSALRSADRIERNRLDGAAAAVIREESQEIQRLRAEMVALQRGPIALREALRKAGAEDATDALQESILDRAWHSHGLRHLTDDEIEAIVANRTRGLDAKVQALRVRIVGLEIRCGALSDFLAEPLRLRELLPPDLLSLLEERAAVREEMAHRVAAPADPRRGKRETSWLARGLV